MACNKWVFPSPASPCIKRGLYDWAGLSATDNAAAWANLLLVPVTKESKVYFSFVIWSTFIWVDVSAGKFLFSSLSSGISGTSSMIERSKASLFFVSTSTIRFTCVGDASCNASATSGLKGPSTRSLTHWLGTVRTSSSFVTERGLASLKVEFQTPSET